MQVSASMERQEMTIGTELPQFDLASIRARVEREHPELTFNQVKELETIYRHFLMTCKNEPNTRHKPDRMVDWYWHAHILHTKQYVTDCQNYFGYYLHHSPNLTDCEDGDPCFA